VVKSEASAPSATDRGALKGAAPQGREGLRTARTPFAQSGETRREGRRGERTCDCCSALSYTALSKPALNSAASAVALFS
jgi:hypothetical protein